MIMKTKLAIFVWGHSILHVTILVCIRPIAYHTYFPIRVVLEHKPNISHSHILGWIIYVPMSPLKRTKIGLRILLEIYIYIYCF